MLNKTRLLAVLTVLTLLFAAPLTAQVANLSAEAPAQNSAQQDGQDGETDADVDAEADARMDDEGASAEASLSADADSGAEAEVQAQARTDTETETATQSTRAEENLPETAGPLALLAVLGTTGLASAFGLRRLRRS